MEGFKVDLLQPWLGVNVCRIEFHWSTTIVCLLGVGVGGEWVCALVKEFHLGRAI